MFGDSHARARLHSGPPRGPAGRAVNAVSSGGVSSYTGVPPHKPCENYTGEAHPPQPPAPTSFSGFGDRTPAFWDPPGLRWQHP